MDCDNNEYKLLVYFKFNFNGLILILVDGDLVFYEMVVILMYLVDCYFGFVLVFGMFECV